MASIEPGTSSSMLRPLFREALVFVGPSLPIVALLWALGALAWQGALRHVVVVALIWFAFVALKTSIQWSSLRPLRLVVAFLQASAWVLIFAVQVGSAVAVASWGQLLTWPITKAYLLQGADMLEVLGVPLWSIGLALFALLLPIALATRFFLRSPLDAFRPSTVSAPFRSLAFAVGAVGLIHYVVASSAELSRSAREPIALFVAHHGQAPTFQNWSIAPNPRREAEAETDRNAYRPGQMKNRPNVVLVVVDALRADHLGLSGYRRSLTPNIDRWASESGASVATMFRSVCAESSCGLMALARSKYPWEVTAVDFALYEVLKKNGYRNYFFLTGDHTNFYGLRDAYRPYDIYVDSTTFPDAYINDDDAIIEAFRQAPAFDGTPTFIQFHLMSSHGLGLRHDANIRYRPQQSPYGIHLHRRLPEGTDLEGITNYYDNGVIQTDVNFARIEELLREKGYLDDALLILTGDHGELLGEGGYVTHARSTEEPVLAPPLLVRRYAPAGAASSAIRLAPIASQVDVAPTILSAIGVPIPHSWSGVPLQETIRARRIFFSQGREVGLYESTANSVHKVVVDSRSGAMRAWRWMGGVTLRPEPIEAGPIATPRQEEWRTALQSELGMAWTGTVEGE